ncbi:phage tail tape measure protein [Oceanimonas smirnovii]|uniref:phage tail tape measure protein n=1 Tax=Oceanimonas smirnovii TaxID=264574 RepID=UPI000372A6E8|nr:phage tail tape measure protein [Oceanimonas smirnovii]
MKHLEQLMLTVSLVDKVTRPIQGINQQIRETGELGRQSMDRMISGAAGLAASGVALHQALMPAIEMDRALGEVKSLGVAEQDLNKLSQTATDFSIEFGKSATEFIGAAYDIKSAMGDLSGDELAGITKSSAVLAAATKADTATVTAYMGTMYGLFKQQADAMGRDNFAAMVAGQTAQAVESFKTTGAEMSAAFTSIGAAGTAAGIAMNEQMAVLGTLQATMSGSEAGTKYKAFLAGIAGAQDKLNMSFVDGNGNMLGMVQILQKLKDKFGDTLTVAESDALKKAFGSDEAVALIKQMIPDVDGLAHSIDNVGKQTGMDKATQMAGTMTDQWERLEQVWFALRAGAGVSVLPTINAVVGSIVDGMAVLVEWTDMFPHLTEVVTWAAIGIASLTAVAASWTLISGISSSMSLFFGRSISLLLSPLKLVRMAMVAMRPALIGLNFLMMANPAGLMIAGIVGVIAVLGAAAIAVYKFWEPIKAFISGFISGFTQAAGLSELFAPFVGLFRLFSAVLGWIGGLLADLFGWFTALIAPVESTTEQLDGVAEAGQTIGNVFGTIFNAILFPIRMAGKLVQWLLEKLNMIPGVDIDLSGTNMDLPDTPDMPAVMQQVEQTTGELPKEAATVPALPPATQQVARTLQPVPTDVAPASQQVNRNWPDAANTAVPPATQQVARTLQPVPMDVTPANQQVNRDWPDAANTAVPPATQQVARTLQPVPMDIPPISQQVNRNWPDAANTAVPAASQMVNQHWPEAANADLPAATQQVARTLQPVPMDVAPASQLVNRHWPDAANTDLPATTQQVDRDLQPVQAEIAPLKQDVFREYFDDLDFEFSPATQEIEQVYTGGTHMGGSFIHSNEELFLPSLVPESPLANTPLTQPRFDDAPQVNSEQLMAGINERLRTTRAPESMQSPPSPLMPQLLKVAGQNTGKTVHFGDVHIKNEQGMDPQTLAEWEELQYGF